MKQIGQVAARILQTGSQTPSESQQIAETRKVTYPLTIEECRELKAWAERQPASSLVPATTDQLAKHLSFMAATLPSKAVDDDAGKMRVAVYSRLFEGYSNEALAYMARIACERCDWFPTPRQCLDILANYRSPTSDREIALGYCHDFTQRHFEFWLSRISDGTADQATIMEPPEQWRRIAVERGYLRFVPPDRYVVRKKPEAA